MCLCFGGRATVEEAFTRVPRSKVFSEIHILHSPGPRLMSIADSDRLLSGLLSRLPWLTHKTFRMCHCMTALGRVPGEQLLKARSAQLGPAEEVYVNGGAAPECANGRLRW